MRKFIITSTNHTSFTVSDLDSSIKFYTDVLGFELLNRSQRDPGFTASVVGVPGAHIDVAYIQAPGHRLELIQYLKPDARVQIQSRACDTGFAHVAFDVDDIHAITAAVKTAGIKPLGDPTQIPAGPNKGGWAVYTRDRDGCTIEYIQRPPGA